MFETFPLSNKVKEDTASKTESGLSLRKKIEKIVRNSIIWAMVSIAGITAIKGFKEERAYKNYKEKVSRGRLTDYQTLKEEIINKLGEKGIRGLETGDSSAFSERNSEGKAPAVDNFEKIGLDSKLMRQIWSEENGMYPKNWINGEIESVLYSNNLVGMEHYGKKFKGVKSGDYTPKLGSFISVNASEEEVTHLSKLDLAEGLDFKFGHEVGHNNDWETNKDLDIVERMQLLKEVLDRMESKKPFLSAQAELFNEQDYYQKIENSDRNKMKYLQAKEYWAEICEHYFGMPEWMQEQYPKDYLLVEKYVKKTDPSYNPIEVKSKRSRILENNYGLNQNR